MKTLPFLLALSVLVAAASYAAEPAVGTPGPASAPASPAKAAPAKPGARSQDAAQPAVANAVAASDVELDTTQITGNRELPRVLYVVPWKRADLGELSGKPTKSLLDEVLAPVDRDVFQRQNRYHDALQPDAAAPGGNAAAGATAAPKVEK